MPEEKQPWNPIWDEKAQRWKVEFTIRGNRIRKRLGDVPVTARPLAKRIAKKLYEEHWQDVLTYDPSHIEAETFLGAVKRYLEGGGERRFIERIARVIVADRSMPDNISVDDFDDSVMMHLRKTMYPDAADATVRRQLFTPVRSVIAFVSNGWQASKPRGKDVIPTRWLTPEEAEKLLVAADSEEVVGSWDPKRRTLQKIAFMLGGGAGPGETIEVDAKNLRPQTGEVWISKDKTEFRPRWVHLPPRAWCLMGDLPTDGPVFLTPQSKPYVVRKNGGGQLKGAFDTVREAAGLGPEVMPYTLRHTWATWFNCQINNLDTLKKRGGWANERMIARYAKLAPADLNARLIGYGWDFRAKCDISFEFGELTEL
jgi:integrase